VEVREMVTIRRKRTLKFVLFACTAAAAVVLAGGTASGSLAAFSAAERTRITAQKNCIRTFDAATGQRLCEALAGRAGGWKVCPKPGQSAPGKTDPVTKTIYLNLNKLRSAAWSAHGKNVEKENLYEEGYHATQSWSHRLTAKEITNCLKRPLPNAGSKLLDAINMAQWAAQAETKYNEMEAELTVLCNLAHLCEPLTESTKAAWKKKLEDSKAEFDKSKTDFNNAKAQFNTLKTRWDSTHAANAAEKDSWVAPVKKQGKNSNGTPNNSKDSTVNITLNLKQMKDDIDAWCASVKDKKDTAGTVIEKGMCSKYTDKYNAEMAKVLAACP
jgi:hypothetical protein